MKKHTTISIIEDFVKTHGQKYDYSRVNYINSKTKVEIICPTHGIFLQEPASHKRGIACPNCGWGKRKPTSQENFIQQCIDTHGDTYSYEKVDYKGALKKIVVICKTHGEFSVYASSHASGTGCSKCVHERNANTHEYFVNTANEIHNYKYDYSKCKYVDGRIKLEIICPVHGAFMQSGKSHLRGRGCNGCAIDAVIQRQTKTTQDFVNRAIAVHGDSYDYSKSIYKGSNKKIEVICPIHGSFWQTPGNHCSGNQGCGDCRTGSFKFNLPAVLYVLKYDNITKVGISGKFKKRLGDIRRQSGLDFQVVKVYDIETGRKTYDVEQEVLKMMFEQYKPLDKMDFAGYTECYKDVDTQKLLQFIDNQIKEYKIEN